jgi:hypothetical protein
VYVELPPLPVVGYHRRNISGSLFLTDLDHEALLVRAGEAMRQWQQYTYMYICMYCFESPLSRAGKDDLFSPTGGIHLPTNVYEYHYCVIGVTTAIPRRLVPRG